MSIGVDAALDAMREAGVDEDARRRVEDILARRAWAQWRAAGGRDYTRTGAIRRIPPPANPLNPPNPPNPDSGGEDPPPKNPPLTNHIR